MRADTGVLHVDADAFFAAVEQRDKPSLAGRPVLVGGVGPRGVVATASYEARAFGARSAMPMAQARRLCPHAAVLAPRFAAYQAASQVIMQVLAEHAVIVEQVSVDEAYADLGPAEPERAAVVAQRVQQQVSALTGLVVSVGAGRSKLVAKIASGAAKPGGVQVVPAVQEGGFLAGLPVRAFPGVGPVAEASLLRAGRGTVAQVRDMEVDELVQLLGASAGAHLYELVRGQDRRVVAPSGPRKQEGAERTFATDLRGRDAWARELAGVGVEALGRLHRGGHAARSVTVKVRFADFSTVSRSMTLEHPTADDALLLAAAQAALAQVPRTDAVRLLGVAFHGLAEHAQEVLDLPGWGPSPPLVEVGTAREDGPRWLDEGSFFPGVDVHHVELGYGWVLGVRDRVATVRFEHAGSGPAKSRAVDLRTDPLLLCGPQEPPHP